VDRAIAGTIPFACDLTVFTPEERSEHMARGRKVFSALERCAEEDDGFTLTFTAASALRDEVEQWVGGELRCCPFLAFGITEGHGGESFAVRISGPDGAMEVLRPVLEDLGALAP
jgi:hypothetical protein